MRLEAGVRLPPFEVPDLEGNLLTPATFTGRKLWLILARFAACPFCSLRLEDVAARHPQIDRLGIQVLVVFPSPEKRVRSYVKKYAPPFLVAADPEQRMFEAFGAETSWSGELRTAVNLPKVMKALVRTRMNPLAMDGPVHRMPSEYLVNPDGHIAHVHYGQELDDGFPHREVVEWAGQASDL